MRKSVSALKVEFARVSTLSRNLVLSCLQLTLSDTCIPKYFPGGWCFRIRGGKGPIALFFPAIGLDGKRATGTSGDVEERTTRPQACWSRDLSLSGLVLVREPAADFETALISSLSNDL